MTQLTKPDWRYGVVLMTDGGTPIDGTNPLPVNATVTATAQTVAKATALAPSYTEGNANAPLSVDLAGNLRTLASVSASLAATANASDPSWTEASSHGLTTDLSGHLRVLAKQQGSWVATIDTSTPGVSNAVAVTNLPAAVDVNSGAKSNGTIRVVLATDQPALTAALKVDGSGVTQPVSGTFWQATQPVSAASLPLPTGAATSAKQPALGTAGTPSTDVLTVQGAASMTALRVDGSAVTQPVSGTFWQATQPISVTALPLPSGAATQTTLAAILTALGTPFQAGASIGNTTFAVTNAGTFAVQPGSDGSLAATAPTKASYNGALGKTALPTAVTDGQMVGTMADKFGRQIVRNAPRELLSTAAISTTGTSGTLLAAQGASVFADMYRLVIANSSAAAVLVSVSDGTNTYAYEVPANATVGFSGAAADATPAAAANTAWTYAVAAGTTTIYISAQFILNK